MNFKLGDVIHNKITKEEGRVVRIANATDDNPAAYIVLVTPNPRWGMTPIEVIWRATQVKK
jgi:hypothetical protein